MDKRRINQPLKKFINRLKDNHLKINQMIVFGSYLEGTATTDSDSDIDVLVASDDFRHLKEDQRLDLLYQARRPLTDPIIHPWGFTPQELQAASPLTTLGYARDHGLKIPVTT